MTKRSLPVVIAGFCLIAPALGRRRDARTAAAAVTPSTKWRKDFCGSIRRPARFRCAASAPSAGPVRRRRRIAPCLRTRSRGCAAKTPRSKRICSRAACRCRRAPCRSRRCVRDGDRAAAARASDRRCRPHGGLGRPDVASAGRGDRARAKASAEQELSSAGVRLQLSPPSAPRASETIATAVADGRHSGEGFFEITREVGAFPRREQSARRRAAAFSPPHLGVARHPGERRRRCAHRSRHRAQAHGAGRCRLGARGRGAGRHAGACQIHAQRRFAPHAGHWRRDRLSAPGRAFMSPSIAGARTGAR